MFQKAEFYPPSIDDIVNMW